VPLQVLCPQMSPAFWGDIIKAMLRIVLHFAGDIRVARLYQLNG
jgi:hypothetical protein